MCFLVFSIVSLWVSLIVAIFFHGGASADILGTMALTEFLSFAVFMVYNRDFCVSESNRDFVIKHGIHRVGKITGISRSDSKSDISMLSWITVRLGESPDCSVFVSATNSDCDKHFIGESVEVSEYEGVAVIVKSVSES